MDIIYLHQYFNTPAMNGSTRSYEMARRLVQQGHRVRMVTSWREPSEHRSWFVTHEEGIEVHWLPVRYDNAMSYLQRLGAFFRFSIEAARWAARISGDLVFATSTPLTIALPAVVAARCKRIPMVFEVRDLWPELPIAMGALRHPLSIWAARWLERFAYRHAAHVVALSPGMRDGVVQTGYPPSRITVIPNSCDLELFSPDDESASRFRLAHPELGDKPFLLYAGTVGKINGVDFLVNLAAAMRDVAPEFFCVVIGSGSEVEKVRNLASTLCVLDKNFFLYPQLSKHEVASAFAAANLAVSSFIDLPEMENNSANKFFDALASGTPVAINYGGWQAELLKSSGAGLVLSRDVDHAAEQLCEWLSDPEGQEQASRAALNLALTRFSRDRLAEELAVLLQETANGQVVKRQEA